jgi:hypothetical protein
MPWLDDMPWLEPFDAQREEGQGKLSKKHRSTERTSAKEEGDLTEEPARAQRRSFTEDSTQAGQDAN